MAILGPYGHIQVLLGDVQADKNLRLHSLLSRPCKCEIMVSGDCSGQVKRDVAPMLQNGLRSPRGRPMGLPLGEPC